MLDVEKWRLLDLKVPKQASMNLAIEEAIFLAKTKRKFLPTLRFWQNSAAVVVGYSQTVNTEVNLAICLEKKIQILRRFTGGGAVFHDLGNLNYSIAIEAGHPLLKGLDIVESFRTICSGVIEGLKEFGVLTVFDPPSNLLIGNKKVSGNAQSRKRSTIFHHGTLLVDVDLDLMKQVLSPPEKEFQIRKTTSKMRAVTNLANEIGYVIGIEEVKEALCRGFENAFSMKLIPSLLSQEENETTQRLHSTKYSRDEWNYWR